MGKNNKKNSIKPAPPTHNSSSTQLSMTSGTKNNEMVEKVYSEKINIKHIGSSKKIYINQINKNASSSNSNSTRYDPQEDKKKVRMQETNTCYLSINLTLDVSQNIGEKMSMATEHVLSAEPPKSAAIVDKVPELASNSSISSVTVPQYANSNDVTPIQCNENWRRMNLSAQLERQTLVKRIQTYVKDHLFKRLKFFNLELMVYDTRKNSVCQKVCNALNMADTGRKTFWSAYSKCVEKAIRYGRNDAVQAMKTAFLGGK